MTRIASLVCAVFLICLPSAVGRREPRRKSSRCPWHWKRFHPARGESLSKVMKSPTISAAGPMEEFVANTDMYQWLLDHPDRTAAAWRKLGVEAVDIKVMKDGRFTWKVKTAAN